MRSEHAVVLGGGFAGLVTAGVLTSHYEQVTVVDRDPASGPESSRRGASQGRHAHNLLPKGAQLIEEIFPGILDEMVADGAVPADPLAGYRFHVAGEELPQVSIGAKSVHATRPFYDAWLAGIRAKGKLLADPLISDETGAEVFADPGVRICGVGLPPGQAERVPGGPRVSGLWPYASGCEDASWAGTSVMPDCGPVTMVVMPMGDLEIDRTWDTVSLRGTGSHTRPRP